MGDAVGDHHRLAGRPNELLLAVGPPVRPAASRPRPHLVDRGQKKNGGAFLHRGGDMAGGA
eukprot:scaffold343_cov120-Isochrysis_galbana.AAC.7